VFGEDTELLVSLSHRLLRDFAELALPGNVQPHDAAALAQLLPRLHKLSGGAGMIGATTIHRLAEAAGAALAGGQAPARVETLLRQLAAAFTALREELAARSLELQSTSE
jgi:HPt (histidine-containing phosphotransfer) domain-containing protein